MKEIEKKCEDLGDNTGKNKMLTCHRRRHVNRLFSVIMYTIKNKILKKSASTTEITELNTNNFRLREAKSYGDKMSESSLSGSVLTENVQGLCYKNYKNNNVIITKDRLTEEIYYVNEDILNYKGINYTPNDIAWTWKKDCRMWLWKNNKELKQNRSVAEIGRR